VTQEIAKRAQQGAVSYIAHERPAEAIAVARLVETTGGLASIADAIADHIQAQTGFTLDVDVRHLVRAGAFLGFAAAMRRQRP